MLGMQPHDSACRYCTPDLIVPLQHCSMAVLTYHAILQNAAWLTVIHLGCLPASPTCAEFVAASLLLT